MTRIAQTWLVSAKVRRILRISTCELAHLRERGVIRAEKRGNAYCYFREDVERLLHGKQETRITGVPPADE